MLRLAAIPFVAALLAPVGVSAAPQDATARVLLTPGRLKTLARDWQLNS